MKLPNYAAKKCGPGQSKVVCCGPVITPERTLWFLEKPYSWHPSKVTFDVKEILNLFEKKVREQYHKELQRPPLRARG
jgi:hypothetical protein